MAKKKTRRGPTRACEKCGTSYHPRRLECPKCGARNPKAGKKVVRKIKRRPGKKRRKATIGAGDPLEAAITFINSVGGIDQAKAVIERIEQIREL